MNMIVNAGLRFELELLQGFAESWSPAGQLKAFTKDVNKAASAYWKWNRSKLLGPRGEDQKAIAFSTLCGATNHTLKMADDLNDPAVNDPVCLAALDACLKKPNMKAEILAMHSPDAESPVMRLLKASGADIAIRQANDASRDLIKKGNMPGITIHFALFDQNKYCLEYNPAQHWGLACFEDKEMNTKYTRLFDAAFKAAQPVGPPVV